MGTMVGIFRGFAETDSDASVSVLTGDSEIGQGSDTIISPNWLRRTWVPLENIKITCRDTVLLQFSMAHGGPG